MRRGVPGVGLLGGVGEEELVHGMLAWPVQDFRGRRGGFYIRTVPNLHSNRGHFSLPDPLIPNFKDVASQINQTYSVVAFVPLLSPIFFPYPLLSLL